MPWTLTQVQSERADARRAAIAERDAARRERDELREFRDFLATTPCIGPFVADDLPTIDCGTCASCRAKDHKKRGNQ